ncbi:mannitol dehydrogenase family protein [Sinirhodobacter sp. WL0062]|uniref:Mannitol dehydrogenase family protein n=1 Tax=Rhodobacter flavimaris TaxID=2907145 RepID=A0ABS8YZ73_9RHOB|nr:mannitol dehydrogenase family protein [Sinirhodobacter sp. WL0062]MCE5974430.1 mannitol dehydrogenase family protein [Sinirhodobacter sp. WL0062]
MKLSNATLDTLPASIRRPTYDRSRLTPGIVHIGLGNFHRAHQAWYLHRLFEMGLNHDWAIVGAGVRPYDAQMREKMAAQDFLTTLIELAPDSRSAEVTGAMIDYLPIEEGNGPLIAQMADPEIRIVALTVTEGGYYIDPVTKGFDAAHPDIQHDATNPSAPRTAFGAMVAALRLRRDRGIGPFTGQSCDNLQGNGKILRQTVVSLARLSDPDLAEWIDTNCTFPNSMVDCIVPATGPNELALVRELGIEDAVPVTHENFRQWVIEDDFCAGRPDWDRVGATFSDRVHDFETMKIRILNGGHQVISDAGEVLGVETISGCMEHPLIAGLFRKVEVEEIVPHVAPVPGMVPEAYVELIARRFSNPAIVDTTRRVAFDGSSRHPGFILPSVRDGLAKGIPVEGLALVSAAWARYCTGVREDGSAVAPNDPFWETLQPRAEAARTNPQIWLENRALYGDLADEPRFAEAFGKWLRQIHAEGLEAALRTYLER